MNPTTTSPPSKTTHRRNIATSSFEPTIKKHPKSPNIKSIIKPLKNLYTSHQNTFKPPSYENNYGPKPQFEEKSMSKSSQQSSKTTLEIEKQIVVKSSGFLSRTRTETTYKAKPISVSSIQDKPMSKSIHQSRKSSLEIEKQKLRASVTGVFYKDSTFNPKPTKEASFESKPMSKTTHQSRKSNVEIEKQKLRASLNGVYDKDSTFSTKPVKETSFQSKPVFVSLIEDKPMSRTTHQSRKSNVEIEKQKLRDSINEGVNKPRDFKVEFSKKLPKEELNVSLSKSQDSGLKAAYRSEGIDLKRPSFTLARGGRRRSFCNSQAELDDFLRCNGVKIVSVDMPPFMQIHAVDCARKTCDSLEKFTSKTLALTLKKEFDGVYGPAWHCIVGSSFGSFVTHSVGGFMYFSMDHKIYVLLFKTTVQRAN